MTQNGCPPGWLEESDPAGYDLCCDGRSMPLSMTDRTASSGLELLSCKNLANAASIADVFVPNLHKYRDELCHARQAWIKPILRPLNHRVHIVVEEKYEECIYTTTLYMMVDIV
jgi:hypothetical protein